MNGILPLWKERGMTSHDCVFKLRKILGTKKVGHTGTLDPNVEGVLPICIGQATRIAEYITDSGKEYVALISIGSSTETEDSDGAVVKQDSNHKRIHRHDIDEALQKLTGLITQIPPMYSAVKVKGKRLYEYARAGIEVERPKRQVLIEQLELLSEDTIFEGPEVTFKIRIKCGKGTYIRTLAVQIGELLGYPAHMASLVRTVSGNFQREECFTLDEVARAKAEGIVINCMQPIEEALSDYYFSEVNDEMYVKIKNGQVLPLHPKLATEPKIVFTKNNKALAVYIQHPTKQELMKPEKMFPQV